jgi:hypothetical protein
LRLSQGDARRSPGDLLEQELPAPKFGGFVVAVHWIFKTTRVMQNLNTYLSGLSEVVFQWDIVAAYLFDRFVADRCINIVPELFDHLTAFMASGSVPPVLSGFISACLLRDKCRTKPPSEAL